MVHQESQTFSNRKLSAPSLPQNLRELRLALKFDTLSNQEFCLTWRNLAGQFLNASNLVGLKLLLLMMSQVSARHSLFAELLVQEYSGLLALVEGRLDRAQVHFDRQYDLAEIKQDPTELVRAAINLGRINLFDFQLEQVEEWLNKAQLVYDLHSDLNPELQVKIINHQAELASYFHLTQKSLEKVGLALELARHYGSPLEEAVALNLQGNNLMYMRQLSEAEKVLREALSIRQTYRDVLGRAETLANLSRVYLKMDQLDMAHNSINGSLSVMRQLKHKMGTAQDLHWKAILLHHSGQTAEALTLAQEAIELRLELNEPTKLAEAFNLLGRLYAATEQPQMALVCYRRILELYPLETSNPQWIDLLVNAGDYLLSVDEAEEVNEHTWKQGFESYRLALAIIEKNEDLFYLAPLLGRLARGLLKLEGLQGVREAARCYGIQLNLLGDIDTPYFEASVAISQRAEALSGIQICNSLLRRYDAQEWSYPTA